MAVKGSICFITETQSFGGTENHTLALIKLLLERSYSIDLVCCRHTILDHGVSALKSEMISCHHTDLSVYDSRLGEEWRRFLNRIKSDVLILPKGWNDMGCLSFLKECRKKFKGIHYIEHTNAHPMMPKQSKRHLGGLLKGVGLWWYREKYIRKARARFADSIIAVSASVARRLIVYCNYPSNKIVIVPNGVDCEEYKRNEDLGRSFRKELNIPEDALVFGMIARLHHEKGIDLAIEAFSRLQRRDLGRSCYMLIIGEGEERQHLNNLAMAFGVQGNVILHGFLDRPHKALFAFDAILFPSRNEGLPLALLEGMAAGCLPVVSEVGGMPEVINNTDVGWVIQPDNADELLNAMIDILAQPEIYIERMRDMVVSRVRSEYNAAASYKKILDICGL